MIISMIITDRNFFSKTGKILAIDWGEKRIGLAVSDPEQKFVFTRPAVNTIDNVQCTIDNEDVVGIVIGLPLRLDGTESETTKKVREFAEQLSIVNCTLPIILFDESLTSHAASEYDGDRKRHKKQLSNLDSESAKILLENFLKL